MSLRSFAGGGLAVTTLAGGGLAVGSFAGGVFAVNTLDGGCFAVGTFAGGGLIVDSFAGGGFFEGILAGGGLLVSFDLKDFFGMSLVGATYETSFTFDNGFDWGREDNGGDGSGLPVNPLSLCVNSSLT